MTEHQIRVLVADDHTLLREALCELLDAEPDFEVVAQAGDARATLRLAVETSPDVALLDVRMPHNEDPAATVRRILQYRPQLRIIVVSMDEHPELVRQLIDAGASGYVHKSAGWQTLAAAVRQQRDPAPVVTLSLPPARTPRSPAMDAGPALSAREIEVLTLVAAALSNRQIGVRMGITEGTVKRHLRNLFEKLGAISRIDAVNKATESGLVHPRRPTRSAA